MEGLADESHLGKILHIVPDDIVDVGRRHARREQIAHGIEMAAQIEIALEVLVVDGRVAVEIQHIGVGEFLSHLMKQPGMSALERRLVAERLHAPGLRADEHQPIPLAKPGEMRVFRKEAVAGMNRLRAGKLGGGDDAVLMQIALLGRSGADSIAFIRQRHVQRALVRLGVYRDGRDAHLLAGADDAHGALSAVGNEYF